MEDEYDQRVSELKSDMVKLRTSLKEAQEATRMAERERASLTQAMTEQNARLAGEVEAAAAREAELEAKLEEMRGAVASKRDSMRDHVAQLEALKQEVKKELFVLLWLYRANQKGVYITNKAKIS